MDWVLMGGREGEVRMKLEKSQRDASRNRSQDIKVAENKGGGINGGKNIEDESNG